MIQMRIRLAILALVLAGCSTEGPVQAMKPPFPATPTLLPDLGLAPELETVAWLNTDSPLRLADLRGKVVGLEM